MHSPTKRLYYSSSTTTEFDAHVVEVVQDTDSLKVLLDATYFYPTSGGQPNDIGTLTVNESSFFVKDVQKSSDDKYVWHILDQTVDQDAKSVDPNQAVDQTVVETVIVGAQVHGVIDWKRRFDHMQQHSGQHLLSAILREEYKAETTSVHIGNGLCTLDIDTIIDSRDIMDALERRFAEIVAENRPMTVSYRPSTEDEKKVYGDKVRLITIKDLDVNACCGTHCSATGDIGPLLIKSSQKQRKCSRFSYYIGHRAITHMQEMSRSMNEVLSLLRTNVEALPQQVDQLVKSNKLLTKEKGQLMAVLGEAKARLQFQQVEQETDGLRKLTIEQEDVGDLEAAMAKAVGVMSKCVFVAVSTAKPYKVILGVSQDAGLNAASAIKKINQTHQGKGGGAPALASCSIQSPASAAEVLTALV